MARGPSAPRRLMNPNQLGDSPPSSGDQNSSVCLDDFVESSETSDGGPPDLKSMPRDELLHSLAVRGDDACATPTSAAARDPSTTLSTKGGATSGGGTAINRKSEPVVAEETADKYASPVSWAEGALKELLAGRTPGRRHNRYFGQGNVKCHRCKKTGHVAADCPRDDAPCHTCGRPGHETADCPQSLCLRCLLPGHQRRECKARFSVRDLSLRRNLCLRCGSPGHEHGSCAANTINIAQGLRAVRCYACGRHGHVNCTTKGKRKSRAVFSACANCGSSKHAFTECRAYKFQGFPREDFGGRGSRGRGLCFRCGKPGHTRATCPNAGRRGATVLQGTQRRATASGGLPERARKAKRRRRLSAPVKLGIKRQKESPTPKKKKRRLSGRPSGSDKKRKRAKKQVKGRKT